jgi:copper(I)-binding protein
LSLCKLASAQQLTFESLRGDPVHRNSSGRRYPRRILIAVAAGLIPMIAGCEAGTNAPSLHWHQPTNGTFKAVGNITISNAFVLGPPIGAVLQPGQNAGLYMGLVNVGSTTTPPDRLLSVSAPGVARSVLLPGNQIVLASQHAVLLTGPKPAMVLQDLLRPLTGGSVVTLVLSFANAGNVTLKVPVMPRAQFYTTLSPPPALTTTPPSPSPTRSRSASPSPSPTASRSTSASPSPTKSK